MPLFKSAKSTQAYLKMGLFGFAGSGKTRTATEVAVGMVKFLKQRNLPEGDRPVFFLDTETGSDYVKPRFDREGMELFNAKTRAFADLIPAIKEAQKGGSILLIDSITHFWREFTETYAKEKNRRRGLEFSDWAYLKAEWGKFTDMYVNSPCHIIMCGRAGYEFDFFQDENGKKQLEKTGIKMKAETETGYEPSLLVLMEREMDMESKEVSRFGYVVKERFGVIDGKRFKNPTFENFREHIELLNLGGEQLGVDTTRNSSGIIEKTDFSHRDNELQRNIVLDEIKELLIKHHPSSSAADKKAKGDLLESRAGTRSWERLTTFSLLDLRDVYAKLLSALENRQPDGTEIVADTDPFSGEPEAVLQGTLMDTHDNTP